MRIQRLSFALALVLAGTFGCQKSSSDTEAPAASASSTSALATPSASASAHPTRPRGQNARHGGIAASLFGGAHDLPDLTLPQQTALAKVDADLKSDDDALRAVMKRFRADLVAGVKAGKLDAAKLAADEAAIDKAVAQHQTQEAQEIESLHAQQKQVAALLAKATEPPNGTTLQSRWDDRKKRFDAVLTAFAGDTIDTKSLDLAILPGKAPHESMAHIVAFFSKLVPILHPDQRDTLAQSIDRPFGGMGHPAPGARGPDRGLADDMVFPFMEPPDHAPDEPPVVQ